MRSERPVEKSVAEKEDKSAQQHADAGAAVKEERPEYSKKTLLELSTAISNIKNVPDSYSLAIRIEMIFSLHLLQQLLLDAQDDLDEKARQILTFLKARWDALADTVAWDVYSRRSRVNQACGTTAACFLNFYPENLTLRQIVNFDKECIQLEKEILDGQVAQPALLSSEKAIYKFLYKNIFAKQPIHSAWSLLPKSIKDAGSDKDTWQTLLSNIVPEIPNRLTLVRMIAKQVEREDWKYFFSRITSHGHLFSLMLGVDVTQLLKVHEDQPAEKRTGDNFELSLYTAADTILRECNDGWGFMQIGGTVGSKFRSKILVEHGCENQTEVMALAYALLETYHRVRARLATHTGWGRVTSTIAPVADKDLKVAGCDILMAFSLQAEQFSKSELENYIAAKKRDGSLSVEKEKEFRRAIEDGVMKMLLEVLCAINEKVRAMPAPAKRL